MYTKKLARQIKRFIGESGDPQGLPELQQRIGSNTNIPDDVRLLAGNLVAFLSVVDETYAHYDDQLKMALRNLTISSDELSEANVNLDRLNAAINAMLESQGEGLMFFGGDGLVSPVFSKATLQLLETNPGGRHISDVLGLSESDTPSFQSLVRMLFAGGDNALDFSDLIGLAPERFRHSRGLQIHLKYRPMHDHRGALTGILVIATDRTAEHEAQKANEAREIKANRLLRIAQNRNSFMHFLTEFRACFASVETMPPDDFARALHTLKGSAAYFWLKDLAAQLNELEQQVNAEPHTDGARNARLARAHEAAMNRQVEDAKIVARDIWGNAFEDSGETRSIELERIYNFARRLKDRLRDHKKIAEDSVKDCLQELAALPVSEALRLFETQLKDFAAKAGKHIGDLRFEGQNLRILPESYAGVFDSFVHIARNIADHGIESPEQRILVGKPPEGRVSARVELSQDGQSFTLTINDDGAGIDIGRLRTVLSDASARETDAEIAQHIFDMRVTTRTAANDSSGRGIGMNAVKMEVEKLGGRIRVDSIPGQGTKFTITLPWLWMFE